MEVFKLGIIIPAFNEAMTIAGVVNSVKALGTVIVVDDGSTDETVNIASANGATVVSHGANKGYEVAINTGFDKADKIGLSAVITFDADGQHKPEYVCLFAKALQSDFQLVLGVRQKPQRVSEYIFKWYTAAFWGWRDPLCGLKGYSMALYRQLSYFDTHKLVGTELAFFGIRNGYNFKQIDILVDNRIDNPRFGSRIRANIKIIRALFKLLLLIKSNEN